MSVTSSVVCFLYAGNTLVFLYALLLFIHAAVRDMWPFSR